jgi:hypothetical protein
MSYIQTILRPPNMSDHTVHAIEGITSGEYPSSQQSFNPRRHHLNNENDMMSEFQFVRFHFLSQNRDLTIVNSNIGDNYMFISLFSLISYLIHLGTRNFPRYEMSTISYIY